MTISDKIDDLAIKIGRQVEEASDQGFRFGVVAGYMKAIEHMHGGNDIDLLSRYAEQVLFADAKDPERKGTQASLSLAQFELTEKINEKAS